MHEADPSRPGSEHAPCDPGTLTVVVADDDHDIRHLVQYMLEQTGKQVHAASDGQSALEACLEHRPDLVLLDVTMPRMSGVEVCRQLRASPALHDVPVILVTAMTSAADVAAGYAAGADDYLPKPFSPRELTDRIDALCHRDSARCPSAPA